MAKETKVTKPEIKYKAIDPDKFREWFTPSSPGYKELCDGQSIKLKKSKIVKYWLDNKIIEKE